MTEHLQTLLRDALLNNSYDYESMDKTINKTWKNSFSYLYTLQKKYVEYEELFYFSNDEVSRNAEEIGHVYLDQLYRAVFDVKYDMIRADREVFRKSSFHDTEISVSDMVYHPTIFPKIPIIIVDDRVIWDYKLRITQTCTHVILPFGKTFVIDTKRNPETDAVIYLDHKVQILIVNNSFYHRMEIKKPVDTNKFVVTNDQINSSIDAMVSSEVTAELLAKWKIKTIRQMTAYQASERMRQIAKRKKELTIPIQDGVMMASFHIAKKNGTGYELGTKLLPLEKTEEGFQVILPTDVLVQLEQAPKTIYLSLIFVNELYHHQFYTGSYVTVATDQGASLLVVQDSELVPYKMPIPVEDFMVFKNGILEKNTEMLEMHYPNIYRIKDESMKVEDVYEVYYFYHKADDLQYTVLFDFYYTFLTKYFAEMNVGIEKIINDIYYEQASFKNYTEEQIQTFYEVFQKILDYQYYNHEYGESDFLHRYVGMEDNEMEEATIYKDDTLRKWIRVQPWVLRDYVLDQHKLGDSFHLFTNTLDLESRLRTDTAQEFKTSRYVFDEPRYVLAFNNSSEHLACLNCRVFVDGILVGDLYQERNGFMDYFYIPADMVTDDSYIEMEIFPEYFFNEEVTFTSLEDTKEITLVEPEERIFPTVADVYLTDATNTLERYDKNFFDFTEHYSRGDYEIKTTDSEKPVKFTRIRSFSMTPNRPEVLNKPLNIRIAKVPKVVRFTMDREGYAYIEVPDRDFNYNTDYMRIFRNGRLMPRTKYRMLTNQGKPRILFLEYFQKNDIIYIDITPYRYREVYYQEELEAKQTLIDIRKVINKPFDIRYYDVYLNGRKLSLNNVFSITPWQLTLVNIKTKYNLVIYEKERDYEYFGLDYNERIYYYSLDDLFSSGLVPEDIKNEMIKDIIDDNKDPRLNIKPNTDEEEKEDWNPDYLVYVIVHIFYYDELIPKGYLNPDLRQESATIMMENFEPIYNEYKRVCSEESFNPEELERRKRYPDVICLDPDRYIEGKEATSMIVYGVGHLGDVDEKLLAQSITIPTVGNIDT